MGVVKLQILAVNFFLLSFIFLEDSTSTQYLVSQIPTVKGKEATQLLNKISERYRENSSERAIFYAEEAKKHATKINDFEGLAQALINIGVVKRNLGKSDEALNDFAEARKIADRNNLKLIQADALHKIGVTYLLLKDYESALHYAQSEILIWRELKNVKGLANALNFKGLIFLNQGKLERAESNLDSSLVLGKSLNDTSVLYKPLVNLGDLYLSSNQPEKAIAFFNQSLSMSVKSNNNYGVAVNYFKVGETNFNMNSFDEAILFVNKSLEAAKKIGYLSLERNCYQLLSSIYQSKNDFEKALQFKQAFIATEDTMFNAMLSRKSYEMEQNFELEKKLQNLEIQKKEEDYRQKLLLFILISVLFAVILIWLIVSRSQSSKRLITKKNLEIVNQANEIEDKRIQLEEQAKVLQEQSEMLESKSQKIDESLDYAKQVQDSLLPPNPSFLNIFESYFVLNLPQDVISGDFCWYTHQGDSINIVVADCSGHGVSGAFNTVIINSLAAQIINETSYRTPADLLSELHKRILKLIPVDQYINFNIGIKIGILKINVNSLRMVYAGAKIPLYYMTKGELKVLKPDKVFVGGSHYLDISNRFNNKMISLKRGDKLMIFTDGYQDQFGSRERGKFMVKNLRKLLANTAGKPLLDQKETLIENYQFWKENESQTDDILAFGVQV